MTKSTLQSINLSTERPSSPHPVLNLGFRIFFLSASIFAILTMLKWAHITFATQFAFSVGDIVPMYWHGHEMIFGYALALIAGFLLTAVKTWTNQPMPYGWKLLGIFLPWALARGLYLLNGVHNNAWLWLAMVGDTLFWLLTCFYVIKPIWAVRQKRQIGIVAKLLLLFIAQTWFYVALSKGAWGGLHMSLLFAFYLIIGVVLTIGRRVMPMFIERGIAEGGAVIQPVKNSDTLDKISLFGFFGFFLTDVFVSAVWQNSLVDGLISVFALTVAVSNFIRLKNWYLAGIWSRPLLWSLWLAFFGMAVGFVMFALQPWLGFSHSLAMHTVALAGVGLMTLAMMARVSLGHTGRSVHHPVKGVSGIFICMLLAWAIRSFMPLIAPADSYLIGVGIAQGLWILAFLWFVISYAKILCSPRTDGLFG